MFYGKSFHISRDATKDEVKNYSSSFDSVDTEKINVLPGDVKQSDVLKATGYQRGIGVIVDKINVESEVSGKSFKILAVMFRTNDKEHPFIVKKYIAEHNSEVVLDDKELLDAESAIAVEGSRIENYDDPYKKTKYSKSSDRVSSAKGGTSGVTAAKGGTSGVTAAKGGTSGVTAAKGGTSGVTAAKGGTSGVTAAKGGTSGVTAAKGDATDVTFDTEPDNTVSGVTAKKE